MDKSSRTYKSLINSGVALSIFVVNLVLQFISRKIFIDYLGTEVLGLNTTATSLLNFLNLAELGVGAAVTYSLYKPLNEKDYSSINEIISLQGWLYRNIALVVILGSSVLMCFFPVIFAKMQLPLWYAYASFGVLLFSSLLGYFINYKEILLTANQQEYKIQYSYRVVLLIKILVQAFCIKYFENGYIWWLVLEFVFAVIASATLNVVIARTFPFLDSKIVNGRALSKKYPVVVTKIKQFFFHKIAAFVLTQTSTIVIYSFTTLTMVAIYGNYMLIVNGISGLLNAIFNGMAAGVGNLVAEKNQPNTLKVFNELFTSRFFVVVVLAFGIFTLSNPFITLWIGEQFVLDKFTLFLIVVTFYLNTFRSVVDSFINAYGLFKDIWAPVAEACLNLGCSICLGYFWGLHGILLGVIISLLIIVFTWKPYFLFTQAINYNISFYVKMYAKHIFILIIPLSLFYIVNRVLPIEPTTDVLSFFTYGVIVMLLFSVSLYFALFFTEPAMRTFTKRFIKNSHICQKFQ